jgi:hypothetical protein
MASKKQTLQTFTDIISNHFVFKLTNDGAKVQNVLIFHDSLWKLVQVRASTRHNFFVKHTIPSVVFLIQQSKQDALPTFYILKSTQIASPRISLLDPRIQTFRVSSSEIINILNENLKDIPVYVPEETSNVSKPQSLKRFRESLSYEEIGVHVAKKQCLLVTTASEFAQLPQRKSSIKKIDVQMACGHVESITYNLFQRRTHHICKQCIYKHLKQTTYNHHLKISNTNITEKTAYNMVEDILLSHYEVEKTHEGCRVDMAVRPLKSSSDEWWGIQLKSINCVHTQYQFSNIHKYENFVIVCVSIPDKRMWVFKGDTKRSITIGKTSSKYEEYEVTSLTFNAHLASILKSLPTFPLHTLKTPSSKTSIIEHNFRLKREKLFEGDQNLVITYPSMDGARYDVIINNLKVQDKCARFKNKQNCTTLYVDLKGRKSYEKGDNDYYWVNCMDNTIYVLPENEIFDENKNDNTIRVRVYLSSKKFKKYHYNVSNPEDVQKIKNIFCQSK